MTGTFDPTRYLRRLGGKDYLEVKWRLLWLRTEHPEAAIDTELVKLDQEAAFALFKATVAIPCQGSATGYGSETRTDFADYIEKAETKALGRALAALGYGTQFCEDHEFSAGGPEGESIRVVDAPVERPTAPRNGHTNGTVPGIAGGSGEPLATPAQVKLIYTTATRELGMTELALEERVREKWGRLPIYLTKREASALIDVLKAEAAAR